MQFNDFLIDPSNRVLIISILILGLLTIGLLYIGVKKPKQKGKSSLGKSQVPLLTSIDDLNGAIEFSGFAYEQQQDIFISRMDAWQRAYGYCQFYDNASAAMSMIIDCEPIYFDYNDKQWLIEFWKGQYGMTTGAEVGIYRTDKPGVEILDFNGTLFQCASDDELLEISHTLYKKGRRLFTRHGVHWWLTGFVLGEFSQPEELSMIIRINFRDPTMRDAFVEGLRKAGYSEREYQVKKLTVAVRYNKPHSPQPMTRTKLTDNMAQDRNRELCEIYQSITGPYSSITDKFNALRQENEDMYNNAIHFGKQKELFESLNRQKGKEVSKHVDS